MYQLGAGCSVTGTGATAQGAPGPEVLCWGQGQSQKGFRQSGIRISWSQTLELGAAVPFGGAAAALSAQSSAAPCGWHYNGAIPECAAGLVGDRGGWKSWRGAGLESVWQRKTRMLSELYGHAG